MKRPLICVVLITILISAARIYFYDPPKIDKVFSDEADTEIQGTVYQISKKTKGYAIYLKNISYMSVNQKVKDDICKDIHHILVYYDSCDGIYLGNTVKICGTLKKLQKGTVPGQFNEFLYYKAKGVDYKVFAKSVLVVNPKLSYYRQFLYQLKDKGTCIFEKYLNDENAGILSAIILGEKSELDAETKALYLKSGIAHILAISGVKTQNLAIPLSRRNRINSAFVPLHIAKIYILKLCLDEEIIPPLSFPLFKGVFQKMYKLAKETIIQRKSILRQKHNKIAKGEEAYGI